MLYATITVTQPVALFSKRYKMNKITIYDIAKALGVNASTVNRAINGRPGVGEEKRRMILDYAQKAGLQSQSRRPKALTGLLNSHL